MSKRERRETVYAGSRHESANPLKPLDIPNYKFYHFLDALDNSENSLNPLEEKSHLEVCEQTESENESVFGTHSECLAKDESVEMDKTVLSTMLLGFELEKMGFSFTQYEQLVNVYVSKQKSSLEFIEVKNLKRWALLKKSELVHILVNQSEEYFSNIETISIGSIEKTIFASPPPKFRDDHSNYKACYLEDQKSARSLNDFESIMIKVQPRKISLDLEHSRHFESLSFECPICMVSENEFLKLECGHEFCLKCVEQYFVQNMKENKYTLDCLCEECPYQMGEKEARLVLEDHVLERFLYFKNKFEEENNPDNKFCSKPDCGKVLKEIEGEKKKKALFCCECEIKYCYLCHEPEHIGQKCNEAVRKHLIQTFEVLNIKKCPGCQSPIQKSDGCNHMTCKQCKSQFCWICLGPYSIHHYKIYNCWGCFGLQYDEKIEDGFCRKVKIISFFFVLPFFALFCLALSIVILPLNLIYQLIAQPCEWISNKEIVWEKRIVKNCCSHDDISYILLYFLMIPRSFVYILVVAPCLYFNKVWKAIIEVL